MPASASSNLPEPPRRRAGEGAALVAEELALEERVRDRGAVDRDERMVAARGEHVDRPREELLARPALALEEDGGVRRGDALGLRAHGLAEPADSPTICGICRDAASAKSSDSRPFVRRSIARATSRRSRSGSTGLVMKSSAPFFIAVDGRLDRAEGRHHDDRKRRVRGARRLEDREPVGPGKAPVGQHDVHALVPNAAARPPAAPLAQADDAPALGAQHLLEHGAQRVLVFDDQDGRHGL